MIHRAEVASAGIPNVQFLHGTAEEIPAPADSFTKVLSVESAYYWMIPRAAFVKSFGCSRPGGSAWILINFYLDNPDCHQWKLHYRIPTHLLSAAEWQDLFSGRGFPRSYPSPHS